MPSPQEREAALFAVAVEKPVAERAAFLQAICGADGALRQRLEVLLSAHDQPDELLANDASNPTVKATIKLDLADVPDEAVGQMLGRYKLLERVGEGGCGTVYVAEQTEPVRRRVALKVIKLGMDTKQVVARFEAERQALAMMDHPNIAKVLDAGTTGDPHPASGHPSDGRGAGGEGSSHLRASRPYFVMELVRGIRITDYCDQANLSTKERLDLFIKVCQAIQHAHQKGIIHRDIKPSNILVTLHDGVPVPKVIDFGIAKATEGRLTDNTVYTQLHQFIGTPAYMSPEQAEMSGLDIDTRSDIYSLGVLLYELLAGSTPFDAKELMASGIDAMRKTIREKEPQRPSTRVATLGADQLTTTAKRRSADSSKLLHQLRGDLDWIVMKCLEKDRTRRYETANGLAADLKRHLSHEPVTARPPSTAYRLQNAFRRNKLVFSAATTVFIALILGLGAAAFGFRQAVKERNGALAASAREESQRREAQQAQANAEEQRRAADIQKLAARRRAYAADMNLAQQALALNNIGKAVTLLDQHRPIAGEEDLRGWEWRYLWQFCQSDSLYTLGSMEEPIVSLSASDDGRWLAAVGMFSRRCRVWDLRSKREVMGIASDSEVARVVFCPKQSLLAIAHLTGSDRSPRPEIQLWDIAAKQLVRRLPMELPPTQLAVSSDGSTIAAASAAPRRRIFCWRAEDGAPVSEFDAPDFRGAGDLENTLVLSGDGKLAAYCMGSQFRVVDIATSGERWLATGAEDVVTSLTFSPDGQRLATAAGYSESDIKLWDVNTGQQIGRLEGHRAWVPGISFASDGKTLVSASADQTVRLWDLATQQTIRVLRGHQHEVWRVAMVPGQTTLISGSKDGVISVWDPAGARQQPEFFTIPKPLQLARFSPDGRAIISLDKTGSVARWHGADFRAEERLLEVSPRDAGAFISADTRFLGTVTSNSTAQLWDLPARKLTGTFPLPPGTGVRRWRGWRIVAGSKTFLTEARSSTGFDISLRSLHTGEVIRKWTHPPGRLLYAVSDDAEWSLSLTLQGRLATLRNHSTGSETTGRVRFEADVYGVCFSPDGKFFAIATEPGVARFWKCSTLEEVATVKGHLLSVHAIGFSPDMKRFVTASLGIEAVKVWDFESKLDLVTLAGEGAMSSQIEFSPDGSSLAVLDDRGTLRLWRAPTWTEIASAEAKEKAGLKQQ